MIMVSKIIIMSNRFGVLFFSSHFGVESIFRFFGVFVITMGELGCDLFLPISSLYDLHRAVIFSFLFHPFMIYIEL